MIDVAIYFSLTGFYFYSHSSETPQQEAVIAIFLYGFYLIIYLLIEPIPTTTSKYMGELYGFLPMLSFSIILFPNFYSSFPDVVTRTIGWVGLITAFVIISYFKLFIW